MEFVRGVRQTAEPGARAAPVDLLRDEDNRADLGLATQVCPQSAGSDSRNTARE